MHSFKRVALTALLAVVPLSPAAAEPALMFGGRAVSDAELAASAGTGTPYQRLTGRQLGTISDFQARNDFRTIGALGRIQMDIWWGTVGSELIAQSVRSSL